MRRAEPTCATVATSTSNSCGHAWHLPIGVAPIDAFAEVGAFDERCWHLNE